MPLEKVIKLQVCRKCVTNEVLLKTISILTAFPPFCQSMPFLYDVCNAKLQLYAEGLARSMGEST